MVEIVKTGAQGVGPRGGQGKVVLGVVKGDLHEIGKNIVKLMLETNGYEVKDLGYDVDSLHFIKAAEEMGPDFIGASSLMTTTMPRQQEDHRIPERQGPSGQVQGRDRRGAHLADVGGQDRGRSLL